MRLVLAAADQNPFPLTSRFCSNMPVVTDATGRQWEEPYKKDADTDGSLWVESNQPHYLLPNRATVEKPITARRGIRLGFVRITSSD